MTRLHPDDIQAIAERVVLLMRRPHIEPVGDLAVLATGGVAALKSLCHQRVKADSAAKKGLNRASR